MNSNENKIDLAELREKIFAKESENYYSNDKDTLNKMVDSIKKMIEDEVDKNGY